MNKFDIEFGSVYTEIGGMDTEVWADGDIWITDTDGNTIYTTIDELDELVKDAREYIEKRKEMKANE